ncbi:CpaD family pilus assembly protein [Phenylobacterium sp.]|jgi:pilus assembly protein CpaD|uniref:CpaD family pilus assembly protein n=1 Tax=Phenylobacterium sp. TaxID=1871053 RepID=UPI002E32C9E3|nr:CpaD family pilus assembly lipoprotein [Phenylobacterium sp.]HEX2561492.1 CpaD family pilus assembly lipoprotein [Phenylobacterium sp.]
MKSWVRPLAGLGLAASVAACAPPEAPGAQLDPRLPTENFKADVADEPHELALAVHGWGLSQNQASALTDFAVGWQASGAVPIRIHVPTGVDPAIARRFGEMVREHLSKEGVPDEAMQMVESGGDNVLRVGYLRRVAVVPECGVQWSDLRRSAANEVQPNFGCAVTANIAAQIAEPNDLLGPRPSEPVDAGRRATVLDKYRKGQNTAAEVDKRADGAVSRAVQ